MSDPALAALLRIGPRERALHAIDPGSPSAVVIGRLDMVFTGADDDPTFSFIERNADSPAGIADQALLEATLVHDAEFCMAGLGCPWPRPDASAAACSTRATRRAIPRRRPGRRGVRSPSGCC